jgi:hypothetical protein
MTDLHAAPSHTNDTHPTEESIMETSTRASKTNTQSTKANVGPHHLVDERTTMVVLDKITVDIDTYELVEFEFTEILPYLLPNAVYTAMDLIGEPVWAELSTVGQRQAIFCLQHMATLPNAQLLELPSLGGVSRFEIVAQPTR